MNFMSLKQYKSGRNIILHTSITREFMCNFSLPAEIKIRLTVSQTVIMDENSVGHKHILDLNRQLKCSHKSSQKLGFWDRQRDTD